MTNVELYQKNFRIANPDFIDKIVIAFLNVFPDYEVLTRGKEREAAGRLAKVYRTKYPNAKTEEALMALETYFKACSGINDQWLRNNMSLSIIVSKFSVINRTLRMERNKVAIADKYMKQGINTKQISDGQGHNLSDVRHRYN